MPIKIRCACGNVLLASENRIGQTGNCPACNRSITVELPAMEGKNSSREDSSKPDNFLVEAKLPKKASWFVKILTFFVYLIFLTILGSTVCLHIFTRGQIERLEFSNLELQSFWSENKEAIIILRMEQKKMFNRLVKKILMHVPFLEFKEPAEQNACTTSGPVEKSNESKNNPLETKNDKGKQGAPATVPPAEVKEPDGKSAVEKKEENLKPVEKDQGKKVDPKEENLKEEKANSSSNPGNDTSNESTKEGSNGNTTQPQNGNVTQPQNGNAGDSQKETIPNGFGNTTQP